MKFSDLPEKTRVKLSDEATEEFWHRIDEFGGIKQLSDSFDYSTSKMYNWKSKGSFLPVELVKKVFGNEASDEVIAIKGEGRSKAIKDPVFPISEDDELLTRVENSVAVSRNRTPIYQTEDRGNAERFIELLEDIGEVPCSVYPRDLYEVRYPKFLHQLFQDMTYKADLPALVDEEGNLEEGKIILPDRSLKVEDFQGELYHRDKKLKLALERNDEETVRQLMSDEARRVRRALGEEDL